jgi:hypothetical protein
VAVEKIDARSPLPGDERYFAGVVFHFERYDLPMMEKWKLALAFLHHGVVAWSEVGRGWLYFSAGRDGQPTVALATEELRRECPTLPPEWERVAEFRACVKPSLPTEAVLDSNMDYPIPPPRYSRALSREAEALVCAGGPLGWLLGLRFLPSAPAPEALDIQLRKGSQLSFYNGTARPLVIEVLPAAGRVRFDAAKAFHAAAPTNHPFGRALLSPDPVRIEDAAGWADACAEYLGQALNLGHAAKRTGEGLLQNRLACQFGTTPGLNARKPWGFDDWMIIDREARLAFQSVEHRERFLAPLRSQHGIGLDDRIPLEADLLALGRMGTLGVFELKVAGADLAVARRQAAFLADCWEWALALSRNGGGIVADLKELVAQKIRLGLLPDEAMGRAGILPGDGTVSRRVITGGGAPGDSLRSPVAGPENSVELETITLDSVSLDGPLVPDADGEDMRGLASWFEHLGLGPAPVPAALESRLVGQGQTIFTTRHLPRSPYDFEWYAFGAGCGPQPDHVVIAHAGHGTNSYFLLYFLDFRGLQVYLRIAWGGAYLDHDGLRPVVRAIFDRVRSLIAFREGHDGDFHLSVVGDENDEGLDAILDKLDAALNHAMPGRVTTEPRPALPLPSWARQEPVAPPTTLEDLCRAHMVLVRSDNEFQRRARLLQALWREDRSYPAGTYTRPDDALPVGLGSLIELELARTELVNFLTPTIRAIVREELKTRDTGKLYGLPRLYNNLLTSQALCFNLFGELRAHPDLATCVARRLWPDRVAKVTTVEFEHSPGRGKLAYLGDRTAFDVYLEHDVPGGGRGFIGIEVKYHEDLDDTVPKLPSDPEARAAALRVRDRYREVARRMGEFLDPDAAAWMKRPLHQLWRDHLLSGALRFHPARQWESGLFVLVYPEGNESCAAVAATYRNRLQPGASFQVVTLEAIVAAIAACTDAPWVAELRDRYLAFEKIDRLPGTNP